MWFLIALLFILWITGYITFGSHAYWVDILLIGAIVLLLRNVVRGRSKASQ